jgi:hypothetical protein
LSSTGYLQVHAYTSSAQIPLQDTAVTITDQSGSAIAMGLTNRSGLLDTPVSIPVPDTSAGQSPNTGLIPYATLNLYAKCKQYEEIYVKDIQVFPDTITVQNLEFIPLSEFPQKWNQAEQFVTPSQNL